MFDYDTNLCFTYNSSEQFHITSKIIDKSKGDVNESKKFLTEKEKMHNQLTKKISGLEY